jgi:hypothetical protein
MLEALKKNSAGIIFFVLLTSISKVVLPIIIQREEYFIFSTWNIFSNIPRSRVVDLSCDFGQTFLFRDHSAAAQNSNLGRIFNRLQSETSLNGEPFMVSELRAIFRCNTDIKIYEFEADQYIHLILKTPSSNKWVGTL